LKPLPQNKTKLVCTIGPASESQQVMEQMLLAGMNVARLNCSHGEFESHKRVIDTLRSASRATGRRVAIMADLSGPKMRIGRLKEEPVELKAGNSFTLTTEQIVGDASKAAVSFSRLPEARQAWRCPLPERRVHPAGGPEGHWGERLLQGSRRRRAAFSQGFESSWH
jgi:pyruvate kinase